MPHGKRQATLVAGSPTEPGPRIGVVRKAVMHVEPDDIAAPRGCDRVGRIEQDDRIAPARECDANASAGGERLCERGRYGRAYVVVFAR
jgi:hypothetical protein